MTYGITMKAHIIGPAWDVNYWTACMPHTNQGANWGFWILNFRF